MEPIAMAEFWWGDSPKTEIRLMPLLSGLQRKVRTYTATHAARSTSRGKPHVEKNAGTSKLEIVYETMASVINKPAGMLSVPGKEDAVSVYSLMREQYPEADGPLTVHRLDMATSGLMLIAKTKRVHQNLQAQFKNRLVRKRYVALLEGIVPKDKGTVDLPLCLNPLDRPRQMVHTEHRKARHHRLSSSGTSGRETDPYRFLSAHGKNPSATYTCSTPAWLALPHHR